MERRLRANRGKNPNARWLVEEVTRTKKRATPKAPKPEPEPDPVQEQSEVRCVCNGAVPDTMVMTECERCNSWQHNKCVFGVNAQHVVPVPYICRWCRSEDDPQLHAVVDNVTRTRARESAVKQWKRLLTARNHPDPSSEAVELEQRLFDTYGAGPQYRAAFRKQILNY